MYIPVSIVYKLNIEHWLMQCQSSTKPVFPQYPVKDQLANIKKTTIKYL